MFKLDQGVSEIWFKGALINIFHISNDSSDKTLQFLSAF